MASAAARVDLAIDGMSCGACVARVERSLNELEGVEASVNLATEQAAVRFDPALVEVHDLVRAVETAGFGARPDAASRPPPGPPVARLAVAVALTAPLVVLAMVPGAQFEGWEVLALALATPVVLGVGWPFHRAAALTARHRAATMDTLVSLGTLAAYAWSLVVLLSGADAHTYFEVAAVITTLVALGRFLEREHGRGRARRSGRSRSSARRTPASCETARRSRSRSPSSASATCSSSGPARRSQRTGSSSRAPPRSTGRSLPASRFRSRPGRATRSPARRSRPTAASSSAQAPWAPRPPSRRSRARGRGAVGQGERAAPGRPCVGGLRAGGARTLPRNARRLAARHR